MRSLPLLSFLALAGAAHADLGLGDKAPPLKVETIVKGKAVDVSKGIHVVDFWASWLEPSKTTVPHLSELAKKYKGKVEFTGVSVGERGDDPLGAAKKFVAAMGSKMDYNVGYDGPTGSMAKTWLEAAGIRTFPVSFVVKDGQILWIGLPTEELDATIEGVLKGTYDVAVEKARREKLAAEALAKQKEMKDLMQPFMDAMNEGNLDDAMTELDKAEAKKPEYKPDIARLRFNVALQTGNPNLGDYAKRYVVELKDDAITLNSLAWTIVDPEAKWPKRDYAAALLLSEQAVKKSEMKDGAILDTYALALFKTGATKKAIEMQAKAVELAKKDKNIDEQTLKEMQARLEEFKKVPAV